MVNFEMQTFYLHQLAGVCSCAGRRALDRRCGLLGCRLLGCSECRLTSMGAVERRIRSVDQERQTEATNRSSQTLLRTWCTHRRNAACSGKVRRNAEHYWKRRVRGERVLLEQSSGLARFGIFSY